MELVEVIRKIHQQLWFDPYRSVTPIINLGFFFFLMDEIYCYMVGPFSFSYHLAGESTSLHPSKQGVYWTAADLCIKINGHDLG